MVKSISLRENINTGASKITQKDTWHKIGALACGSLLGSVGVMLTNKLMSNSSRVFQYGVGTLSSGALAVISLGFGFDNVGYGAGMVSAGQALNTASSLLFDKSIGELIK